MKLDLGEVLIRSFARGDAAALARHADNRKIWLNVRDHFPHPYTAQDAEDWLAHALEQDPETNFAIAIEDELIGGIGLVMQEDVYRFSAEMGYWLGEEYWDRGIATLAVTALTRWAFENMRIERIFAYVFESNPASARVLEKAGFTREGCMRSAVVKAGRVMDQLIYGVLRDEVPAAGRKGTKAG